MQGKGINWLCKETIAYKSEDDLSMVKSMDLDMDDQEPLAHEIRTVGRVMCNSDNNFIQDIPNQTYSKSLIKTMNLDVHAPKFGEIGYLSTVYEGEEEQDHEEKGEDEEVDKEVIEEKRICSVDKPGAAVINIYNTSSLTNMAKKSQNRDDNCLKDTLEDGKESACSRLLRIQNIFTLCGNNRELSQHIGTPIPKKTGSETFGFKLSPVKNTGEKDSWIHKENMEPQFVRGN